MSGYIEDQDIKHELLLGHGHANPQTTREKAYRG